jgi:hypothetical protein
MRPISKFPAIVPRWCASVIFAALALSLANSAVAQVNYTGTVLYPLYIGGGAQEEYYGDIAAGQTVGGKGSPPNSIAYYWSAGTGTPVKLNPSGYTSSLALGTDGAQQVGSGTKGTTINTNHALLWSGTAASAVDLNPSGFVQSSADTVAGGQQAGSGQGSATGGNFHALIWSGTAQSAIDVNPTGFLESGISDTNGSQQVGSGNPTSNDPLLDALLWSGSANSVVNLGGGAAFGISPSGNQQVGYSSADNQNHAFLWTGSAASASDLNPAGFVYSYANATNGVVQAGYGGAVAGDTNALLWFGTAASAVNLHLLLPSSGTWTSSTAFSVDAAGNVFGTAYGDYNGVLFTYAVEWSPLPEPGSGVLMVTGLFALLGRRRRTQGAGLKNQ